MPHGMEPPARIGRYEVLAPLGQGGMGRVLLARDTVLGRKVAIKILRDDLGIGPEVKASLFDRMRQEARAAATLSHPNIVTLHDMGEEESVGLYLVFEYIEGDTLRDRLLGGALPAAEVAKIARQIGGALSTAHAAGVIHRDVKPENVMLAAHGAKITDFGIARLPDSTLTRAGSILGTPAYSAPEALATAEFSAASDQFSFAATLYEALSGVRAFQGDDALTVASRVANETPTPIASFTSADRVLARAMSKDKNKRYESCETFGEALAASLERSTAPIATPRWRWSDRPSDVDGPRSIVSRQTKRWQNLVAATAVLVIVALVVIGRRQAQLAGASLKDVADAFASVAASHAPPPTNGPSARPRLPLSIAPSASASASAQPSASAAPSSAPSSAPSAASSAAPSASPSGAASTTAPSAAPSSPK